jgi:hypothetical protein
MAKIVVVKKGGSVAAPMPCPWFVDMPAETKR